MLVVIGVVVVVVVGREVDELVNVVDEMLVLVSVSVLAVVVKTVEKELVWKD